MSEPELEVIVLDDRSRFALHVWRYLSRSVGFGIGRVPLAGESSALRWPLKTPARDAQVRWVNIGRSRPLSAPSWEEELKLAVEATEKAVRRVFLVDVRGDGSGAEEEFWTSACDALEQCGVTLSSDYIWLVSSYGVGARQRGKVKWTILPKNVETLQELAQSIWPEEPQRATSRAAEARTGATGKSELHILVTGAGFELKSSKWPEISPLGVPFTEDILGTAFGHKFWPSKRLPPLNTKSYPCPWITDGNCRNAASFASDRRDLDRLWNALLESLLAKYRHQAELSDDENHSPSQAKADMLEDERQARETFRSAFLNFDWGLLTQALHAASLPWDVWLTTNYTQFVDRAVALLAPRHRSEEQVLPPWRILSIAPEAELLIRQLFFIGKHGEPAADRYIFKLHGDLAHLSTMAIAGHDKELFSPFTHSVGSLHWMYEAAGRWIERRIRQSKNDCRVNWHIVGHGLGDEVLVQTIQDVVDATKHSRVEHEFHFVQPFAKELLDTDEKVKDAVTRLGTLKPRIFGADEWMATLVKFYRKHGRMLDPSTDL
jgi:hypothetical protein